MFTSLLQSTSIPVLEQVVQFSQMRHGILAGNLANLDTPGYKVRDLSPERFEERLAAAIEERRNHGSTLSPSERAFVKDDFREVKESFKSILYHDESNVSLEHQITEMAKNQAQHNLALTIMTSQFRLLQAAISEQVA